MNISSTALRPQVRVAPKTAVEQKPAAEESTTFSSDDSIGWGDAAVGLATGLATGVVTGAGAGLTSIKHSILGTGEAYKALWTNETIGPVLKGAIGFVLPIATVGVPILSALIGAGAGMYQGFVAGAKDGMSAGLAKGTELVKEFNTNFAPGAREEIREFGEQKLEEGEEVFDISPLKGVGAAAAGIANTAVGAVGIGLGTAVNIPEALITGNRVIAKSDMGLPMKVVSHAVSLPLGVVALGLGPVAGALFGLGSGVVHGYQDGFVESFKKTGEYIGDYNKYVGDGLDRLAEELVKNP